MVQVSLSVCLSVPHEQESLNLTCVSNNGKPAATFKWFRWVCLCVCMSVCLYLMIRRASIWPVSLTMVNLLQPSSGSGESVCVSVCLYHMSRRASTWPVSLTMVNLLQPSSGSGESVCLSVPHEQESHNLTCVSNNGKPAATFKWFRWVCLSVCLSVTSWAGEPQSDLCL